MDKKKTHPLITKENVLLMLNQNVTPLFHDRKIVIPQNLLVHMIVKPTLDDLPRVKGFNVSIPYICDHVESIVGDLTNTTNKETKVTTNEMWMPPLIMMENMFFKVGLYEIKIK